MLTTTMTKINAKQNETWIEKFSFYSSDVSNDILRKIKIIRNKQHIDLEERISSGNEINSG